MAKLDISGLSKEQIDLIRKNVKAQQAIARSGKDEIFNQQFDEMIKLRNEMEEKLLGLKKKGKIPSRANLQSIADLPRPTRDGKQDKPANPANYMRRRFGKTVRDKSKTTPKKETTKKAPAKKKAVAKKK